MTVFDISHSLQQRNPFILDGVNGLLELVLLDNGYCENLAASMVLSLEGRPSTSAFCTRSITGTPLNFLVLAQPSFSFAISAT